MSEYIIWSCEYNSDTGEGQLGRKFVKSFFFNKNIKILYPKNSFLLSNYIYQIYGIFVLWFFYFLGKKTVYLNYVPLWNFLIFLFAPPKTIFGPLTGSIQINKIRNFKSFVRFYIFPLFYKISLIILKVRSEKIIFATNILLKYLDNSILKKSQLNFVLKDFNINKNKRQKKYDFIIYFRRHENKFYNHHRLFIKNQLNKGKKILVVGDNINIKGVKQIKRVNREKIINLIKISKYTISGDENLLSLFNIDCLKNNVKIIFNYKLSFQISFKNKKLFLPYNYELKKFIK